MKRVLSVLLALTLTLTLGLTACSGGSAAAGGNAPGVELSTPEELAAAFVTGGAFSEDLETLELEVAYRLYDLDAYDISREAVLEGTIFLSAGATAEEVAVLKLADEDAAALALEALNDHVQAQIESYQDYLPGEVSKLDNALVKQYGPTVLLVVPADPDKAEALLP